MAVDLTNRLKVADLALRRLRAALQKLGPVRAEGDSLFAGEHCLNEIQPVVEEVARRANCGCTIFHGNVRIATTARAKGGLAPAIGTTANAEVTELVLHRGESFRGVTTTLGREWVIVYEPLEDADGQRVGMLAAYRERPRFD